MKLADVSVKRPVFAIMMTAALIVLGAFSYQRSRSRSDAEDRSAGRQRAGPASRAPAPKRSRPRSPSAIEEAVNTISGIDELRANSEPGPARGQHHVHARARHRVGDAGRPRQGRDHRRPVPARRPAAADPESGSRRVADSAVRRLRPAIARRRSRRSPTSRSSRSSRR